MIDQDPVDPSERSASALASFFGAAVDGALPHMSDAEASSLAVDASADPMVMAIASGLPGLGFNARPVEVYSAVHGAYCRARAANDSAVRNMKLNKERAQEDAEFANAAFSAAGMSPEAAGRAQFDAALGDTRAVDAAVAAYYFA